MLYVFENFYTFLRIREARPTRKRSAFFVLLRLVLLNAASAGTKKDAEEASFLTDRSFD
jgi:hypothetical protein